MFLGLSLPKQVFLKTFWLVLISAMMLDVESIAEEFHEEVVYQYSDTQRLVTLVNAAAELLSTIGEEAFEDFSKEGSRWYYGQYYLFVYSPESICLFHPVQPDLVGKDMKEFRDINGKPVVELITKVGEQSPGKASDWVFYKWPDKDELLPHWKGAYIRKVAGPDGKIYFVGSGAYNLKTERSVVEHRVQMAAELLEAKGKKYAFKQFRSSATPYSFLDAYVFVVDLQGRTIFDPAYPTLEGRSVLPFQDAIGKFPVKKLLKELEHNDQARLQYLWRNPGVFEMTRKSIYAEKVKVGDQTLIVGSDYFLATPIWMQ